MRLIIFCAINCLNNCHMFLSRAASSIGPSKYSTLRRSCMSTSAPRPKMDVILPSPSCHPLPTLTFHLEGSVGREDVKRKE